MKNLLYIIIALSTIPFGIKDSNYKYRGDIRVKPIADPTAEFIFEYSDYDPANHIQHDELWILQAGDSLSRFSLYGHYRLDSLTLEWQDSTVLQSEWVNVLGKDPKSSKYIYLDFKNKELETHDRIPFQNYRYYEPLPEFGWTILDDKKEISGIECYKATTNFRGRDWTVWFAPEIPISQGPWKFHGLPGMILEAYDTNEEHVFELVRIRNHATPILRSTEYSQKVTREDFRKRREDFVKNPAGALNGLATDINGKPKRKAAPQFSNFIEKQ